MSCRGDGACICIGIANASGFWFCFFFFKQKTAYEMQRGLVGSEMCIRDRVSTQSTWGVFQMVIAGKERKEKLAEVLSMIQTTNNPVSYTHLTLPTILLVQISVVAVSLKKKKKTTKNKKTKSTYSESKLGKQHQQGILRRCNRM
eukprot:TRINITY_DN10195_c0_g1_i2.p2 TRINITY_DN10195_c0_g1~~TRINITY_DN10195_c0_g1_i2.p2  ORF type:complete len:145 (-),score=54.38 TRINITY_DN10195_c0_g1_i2:23-457(-)